MNRINIRKKIKINKLVLIICLILVVLILISFYIKNKVTPLLIQYSILEAKKRSSILLSNSIKEVKVDDLDFYKINDGTINTIEFNTILVNNYLSNISLNIVDNMERINNTIQFKMPLVSNNPFLSHLSLKLPVKINFINSLTSNIKTKISNYGINNALIEVSVSIIIEEAVIIPFKTEIISVSMDIPILLKLVNGNIPQYYSGIEGSSQSFSLPIN